MERGYWLPPNAENLAACDGFYIVGDAVYATGIDEGWNKLLDDVSFKLKAKETTFRNIRDWKATETGYSRFVILQNRHIDIVAEDNDDLVAVYALIPEDCPTPGFAKRSFPRYMKLLKDTLTELYPGNIFKRINSQHIQAVS